MEQKGKTIFFNKLLMTLTTLFLFIFTACNNNSSNTNSTPVPINPVLPMTVAPGCVGCMQNAGVYGYLATTDSYNGSRSMYLGLDFYGNSSMGNFMDPKIPLKYSGIVQAKGILRVQYSDTDLCNLPHGDYAVATLSPGTWQGGVTSYGLSGFGPSSLRLQAQSMQNGSLLIFHFVQGIIYNGTSLNGVTKLETARLGGSIVIETLNGNICHASLLGATLPIELN